MWTPPRRRAGIVLMAALLGSACATGRPSNLFLRGSGSGPIELMESPPPALPVISKAVVESAANKARLARIGQEPALPTIEGTDPELGLALQLLTQHRDSAAHLRVGRAYARLRVFDLAIDHFDRALERKPRSAAAYDARARIWRDWHLPGFALGDAYRAVHFAPESPVARSTLGTVLMELGHCAGAKAAFEHALALDPAAGYATAYLERLDSASRATPAACRDGAAVDGSDGGSAIAGDRATEEQN